MGNRTTAKSSIYVRDLDKALRADIEVIQRYHTPILSIADAVRFAVKETAKRCRAEALPNANGRGRAVVAARARRANGPGNSKGLGRR